MSVSSSVPKNDADTELDWISLRQELDAEREKDMFIPPYKRSFLVKLGLAATTISFGYTLLNMHNTKKMFQGASSRILFQFLTIMMFGAGYYDYTKSPEYGDRMSKER